MKKVEQILKNGHIIQDYDEKLSTSDLFKLYGSLFPSQVRRDGKQVILYGKIGVLTANVTYLGHPHPAYKKRIQLKDYYPDYYFDNKAKGLKTLYVGVYTYKATRLYVVFEPTTYSTKKSHNSSAHIFSMNLQYAQRTGEFFKEDAFGNSIHVFKREHFIKYIKSLAGICDYPTDYEGVMAAIRNYMEHFFKDIPTEWKGIDAYKQMESDPTFTNYRQNRWPGFYFEFLFQNHLNKEKTKSIQWNSDKTEEGIDFDIVFKDTKWNYGDLKADQINEDILGNSFDTFDRVVDQHNGIVYYICALYKAEKDSDHGYEVSKYWNSLRDTDKQYTDFNQLKQRAGKAMKYSVKLQSINILKIDKTMYSILKESPFNQGVNSDGKPRAPKLKVKKDMISALSVYQMNY